MLTYDISSSVELLLRSKLEKKGKSHLFCTIDIKIFVVEELFPPISRLHSSVEHYSAYPVHDQALSLYVFDVGIPGSSCRPYVKLQCTSIKGIEYSAQNGIKVMAYIIN